MYFGPFNNLKCLLLENTTIQILGQNLYNSNFYFDIFKIMYAHINNLFEFTISYQTNINHDKILSYFITT